MKAVKFQYFLVPLMALFLLISALPAAAEEDSRWTASTSEDEDGNTVVDFAEVQFVIPADWVSKVQLQISPSAGRADVYHTASRQKWTEELGTESGGFLFGITFMEEDVGDDIDGVQFIGHTEDGYYYAYFPTDFQAYTKDEAITEEYRELWADIDWVKDHIRMTVNQYIIPNSSTEYLTEADLEGMSANKVQMAINEIYARHGRKFQTESIQEYFDAQSWYEGTIEPDDFDVNLLNAYENANILLMVDYMDKVS